MPMITNYDGWAMRVDDAIRKRSEREGGQPRVREVIPVQELLLIFAREAMAIAAAIGRNIEDVSILGADRYEALVAFVDRMLTLDDFSFFEFRYRIPGKREPGLRFKVRGRGDSRRIEVQYFEDLIAWPVDEGGDRIFTEPIGFDLGAGRITFAPHPSMFPVYAGCGSWQTALRETLALPFRFLYNSAEV